MQIDIITVGVIVIVGDICALGVDLGSRYTGNRAMAVFIAIRQFKAKGDIAAVIHIILQLAIEILAKEVDRTLDG